MQNELHWLPAFPVLFCMQSQYDSYFFLSTPVVHAGEWDGWYRAARQFLSAQLLWNVYKLCTMYAWRPKAPAPVHPMNRLSLRLVTAHAWGINAFSPALPKIHFSCSRILRTPSLSSCLTSLLGCVEHLPGLISLAKDAHPRSSSHIPFQTFWLGSDAPRQYCLPCSHHTPNQALIHTQRLTPPSGLPTIQFARVKSGPALLGVAASDSPSAGQISREHFLFFVDISVPASPSAGSPALRQAAARFAFHFTAGLHKNVQQDRQERSVR